MRKFIQLLVICVILNFFSCKKDKFLLDSSAKLSFSQDSVFFDTVFTSVGSTTKYFRVINKANQKIKISSLKLARGASSFFRLNVDGVPGKSFNDLEINANDSLYIFIEATIDPNNLLNPFIYKDSIVFETNGNIQDIDLIAFARNAWFHYPKRIIKFKSGGEFGYSLSSSVQKDSTWKNDKPHVIYGYVVVDSSFTLNIDAGTQVYLHANSGIWVYRFGTIKVNGTAAAPITFQHDRLEPDYKDIAGQWDRIWISEGSDKNIINHAIIKNSFIGIQATFSLFDGIQYANANDPKKIKILNTQIQNCSGYGVYTNFFNVEMGNCVVSNCGNRLLGTLYGGSYSFRHCTFANYWHAKVRNDASIFFNNYTPLQTIPIDSAYFENCIVDGLNAEELEFDTASVNNSFKHALFKNCIIKTQINTSAANQGLFKNVLQNANASFINPKGFNFKLNNNSAAIDMGTVIPGYPLDIEGKNRVGVPDIGAYEKQ